MSGDGPWTPARRPENLGEFFVERANAGQVEGLVALYEPDAVLALPTGEVAIGRVAIRQFYQQLLADRPTFATGGQRPALINCEVALTSTRLPGGGATAEIARCQPDDAWLWTIDQPNVLA
ncbi:MAG: YybH family protein [Pseudonocardiaceae bacterium]